ncbi:uncharacterized protein B0I36DRAFT_350328 [Microdochium trichocladiopsis]|uniref:Uncharacterized protein n=1 Tax=Microdochium trichocladiopsis TaxID=1682393 RepID=A0A9P9BMC1_9PEZI|nr:uncharacterized protein B0I36DRAFT_350328 [Microdochium trichocladiopsis]KAH7029453.1 hypothetical protein B0I36DRAFT_350328 [Microdochium trichocladiopsis]
MEPEDSLYQNLNRLGKERAWVEDDEMKEEAEDEEEKKVDDEVVKVPFRKMEADDDGEDEGDVVDVLKVVSPVMVQFPDSKEKTRLSVQVVLVVLVVLSDHVDDDRVDSDTPNDDDGVVLLFEYPVGVGGAGKYCLAARRRCWRDSNSRRDAAACFPCGDRAAVLMSPPGLGWSVTVDETGSSEELAALLEVEELPAAAVVLVSLKDGAVFGVSDVFPLPERELGSLPDNELVCPVLCVDEFVNAKDDVVLEYGLIVCDTVTIVTETDTDTDMDVELVDSLSVVLIESALVTEDVLESLLDGATLLPVEFVKGGNDDSEEGASALVPLFVMLVTLVADDLLEPDSMDIVDPGVDADGPEMVEVPEIESAEEPPNAEDETSETLPPPESLAGNVALLAIAVPGSDEKSVRVPVGEGAVTLALADRLPLPLLVGVICGTENDELVVEEARGLEKLLSPVLLEAVLGATDTVMEIVFLVKSELLVLLIEELEIEPVAEEVWIADTVTIAGLVVGPEEVVPDGVMATLLDSTESDKVRDDTEPVALVIDPALPDDMKLPDGRDVNPDRDAVLVVRPPVEIMELRILDRVDTKLRPTPEVLSATDEPVVVGKLVELEVRRAEEELAVLEVLTKDDCGPADEPVFVKETVCSPDEVAGCWDSVIVQVQWMRTEWCSQHYSSRYHYLMSHSRTKFQDLASFCWIGPAEAVALDRGKGTEKDTELLENPGGVGDDATEVVFVYVELVLSEPAVDLLVVTAADELRYTDGDKPLLQVISDDDPELRVSETSSVLDQLPEAPETVVGRALLISTGVRVGLLLDTFVNQTEVHTEPLPLPTNVLVTFAPVQGGDGKTSVIVMIGFDAVKVMFDDGPLLANVDVQAPPLPELGSVVIFSVGHENGGNTLVMTVGVGPVKLMVAALELLVIQVDVQGLPVPVPVSVKVALAFGQENGGKLLATTEGLVPVTEGWVTRDPLALHADVHALPEAVPVIVVVFSVGQENGGNTLVIMVTCGTVYVTLDGLDPLLIQVDVHDPPIPVPVTVVVVFWLGQEKGGKTLVTTVGKLRVDVTFAVSDALL